MSNFWTLFLLFTIYSFIGWLCESIFCSVPTGKFINRGFLNGPFCPIYGAGGMLVIILLSPFKNNLFLLYIMAVFITSLLEFLTSLVLEKLFNAEYWDYSKRRFNFHGRVCLVNSLVFGVMGVVGIWCLNPVMLNIVGLIPSFALPFVSLGFMLYFLIDTAATVSTILRLNGKLAELQQVLDEIKEKAHTAKVETIEVLQATVADHIDDKTKARIKWLYEKKNLLETGAKVTQRRIIEAFPTMKSIRNNESLQRIKEIVQNGKKFIRRG